MVNCKFIHLMKSIPNYITLFRIAIIPMIISTFYFRDSNFIKRLAVVLFFLACITDFIDGWLARKLECQSTIGEMLDPLADKILVSTILILLVRLDKINILPCLLIISREITISSLRGQLSIDLKSSYFAKIKTTVQMVSLFLFLLSDAYPSIIYIDKLAAILLWIATIATLCSGYSYLMKYIHRYNIRL